MGSLIDLTNRRFGRLFVLRRNGSDGRKHAIWECECDCGRLTSVLSRSLLTGATRSCGCLQVDLLTKHGRKGTRLYNVWRGMLARCANPRAANYHGRGIGVCRAWREFEVFLRDMGEPPYEGATVERIDNDGNYEPGNCRWATRKEQANNMRTNRWLEYNGQRHTLAQWSDITGLGSKTISDRLDRGWSIGDALTARPMSRSEISAMGNRAQRSAAQHGAY